MKIGCIANNVVFKHLVKDFEDKDIDIINLKEAEVNDLMNFDLIIHNNMPRRNIDAEKIRNISKKSKYLLINSDEDINIDLFKESKMNIITYGLNDKATITISSVEKNALLLDIQREIERIDGEKIEVGETKVDNIRTRSIQEILLAETVKKLVNTDYKS